MSLLPAKEPVCLKGNTESVELTIDARPRDLGGFSVRRLLPSSSRRLVGPFIFFDHMGPAVFSPGQGMDVRPHPHINLATVTYLFEGEIVHRDSLGSHQSIRPGEINWMTAGSGIVHSERSPEPRKGGRVHGIQLWVALPKAHEEAAPEFHHHAHETIPKFKKGEVGLRVLAGKAYGAESPVHTFSPLFYVEALMPQGSELPLTDEHEERAVYIVEGSLLCNGGRYGATQMLIFRRDAPVTLRTEVPSRILLLGGAPLDGERHIWWNFVSSSQERMERAKRDWKEGRFPKVPGDEVEFIPLPE